MKHIIKGEEPTQFAEWKALANAEWQPTYSDLRGEEKAAVKTALMEEQGYICCYCERKLDNEDSHIEHIIPQSENSITALDFSNMACSCQKPKNKGIPLHCGNKKGNWYEANSFVSPLDPDCEQCFIFTGDGHIHPAEHRNEAAKKTISHLDLDIPKLVALREAAISIFQDEILTQDEVQKFAIKYLEKTPQGTFNEFWTTIKYLFAREIAV
jgi:uncharacterized protein (TIGR02646 family)